MSSSTVWHEFAEDPRNPAHAGLRAADADRDVVRRVLGDAYAEGKLDREEFDERSDVVATSRTLGELPPIIDDLVPRSTAAVSSAGRYESRTVEERAVRRYERGRREAVGRFAFLSTLCWAIWIAASFAGSYHFVFPWPVFVMFGTGLPAARFLAGREDIIAEEIRKIEKKDRKELAQRDFWEIERRVRNRWLGPDSEHRPRE
jgi:hypothetical protein